MADSVVLAPREFKKNSEDRKGLNIIDRLFGVFLAIKDGHMVLAEQLTSVVHDLKAGCEHEPGYLAEDLILQPSKVDGVFLAETEEGHLKTFAGQCKFCNTVVRYFVGQVCPSCLNQMRKSRGPLDLHEYVPLVKNGRRLHDGCMSVCDHCDLVIVWDSYGDIFDYLSEKTKK